MTTSTPPPATNSSRSTSIQWTQHTINFWWGCTKVSPACKHCYAETLGRRFGPMHFGGPVLWGDTHPRQERLQQARAEALKLNAKAAKTGQQCLVFVNSMSDWLDAQVPIAWLAFLLETIYLCPNVTFQLLTKRPENWKDRHEKATSLLMVDTQADSWAVDWLNGHPPPNVWLGTTVENQEWADKRIPHLQRIPAKVRFLSCEPLVGPIDLKDLAQPFRMAAYDETNLIGLRGAANPNCYIHWVITGGESGGQASPTDPDHFRSLRDQCAAAGVPFFFKQWGEWLPFDHTAAAGATKPSYKGQQAGPTLMLRVGVSVAGNLLDGQHHLAFPTSTN